MRILVMAPHPDDEVLGCGGTIARHVQNGDEVYLCIVTRAYPPKWSEEFLERRPLEIKRSNEILGIKKTFFLNFPTVKLDTLPQVELNDKISSVVEKIRPDIAYIPHRGDLNRDHRLVFEASLVALRPKERKIKRILAYEVLSETEWGQPLAPFHPNVYVDITGTLPLKLEAMKAYSSEVKEFPHPRSLEAITSLAIKRGSEACLERAEAFQLIREIIL